MKKTAMRLAALLLLFCICTTSAYGAEYLVPGGQVIGLELRDDTVTVAAFDASLGATAREAGLREGDRIVAIDDRPISSAADVKEALTQSKGHIRLTLERKGKEQTLRLQPRITADGPKLGVYLRQGVTGIGTVTWFDPETRQFGCLGHGVVGSDGRLLRMVSGKAYRANIASVKTGKVGEPGQLRGVLTDQEAIATLARNTSRGLFGTAGDGWQGQPMEVASAGEIQTGPATILSTVDGDGVREYSVEICRVYPKAEDKNLLIRVTDPDLLRATGGIVQGMSGSPIIQDGKLVGAVTHVLVNDPTRGYGIFIENMLDAAA